MILLCNSANQSRQETHPMMKILVAEDNEMTAEIMRLHLRKHGYEAILASNGVEALECLESTPDISLVVTDVMMPEMDGFALVAEMRRRLEWSEIPVVVASAKAEPEAVTRAAELGCRQFLVKPIHDSCLVKAIKMALNDQRALLRPQHEVLAHVGIDSQTYRRLVERFAVLAEPVIRALEESLADQAEPESKPDPAELARLMEAATLLGADRLAQVVANLAREDPQRTPEHETSQRRLLLRELTMLLMTLGARKARVRRQQEEESESDDSEDTEKELREGGRRLDVRKHVVRVS